MERQVWQGSLSGGAVKQSMLGRLDEVPVPKNMTSIYLGDLLGWMSVAEELCHTIVNTGN